MSGIPILSAGSSDFVSLTRAGRKKFEAGSTEERFLQHAVNRCPSLIPYKEFFRSANQIISLGEEIPVHFAGGRSGYIDNLLLTDDGHLILLEMKLWRNPEAVREVVAQTFEYGMTLSQLGVSELEKALWSAAESGRKLPKGQRLTEFATEHFSESFMEQSFAYSLEKFLHDGEVLYLIAGDGIHVSVQALAEWINSSGGRPYHFGLLELNSFLTPTGDRFVVPRLLVKTNEIARHVVVVEVGGVNAGLARVQIDEEVNHPSGALRLDRRDVKSDQELLTVDGLIGLIRRTNGEDSEATRFAVRLINSLQDHGFDSRPSRTEIAFGMRDTENRSTFYALVSVAAERLYLQYPQKALGREAANEFRDHANKVAPFFDPRTLHDLPSSKVPKFSDLLSVGDALLEMLVAERDAIRRRITNDPNGS